MNRPLASLSLDLDNKWSYLKTHGDPGWERFPTYLDRVVPRFLDALAERNLKITVFVVGQDAALDKNFAALASISAAGHEIGNHSFHHEPWLHLYGRAQLEDELTRAEERITAATGCRPRGFRGPGFSMSPTTLEVLVRRDYQYDASTFPTFLGPLARAYYFLTARLTTEQKKERKLLFGSLAEGLRPLRPYYWELPEGQILEIPVTTMPFCRAPFHVSYLLYLRQFSRTSALAYFRTALSACRVAGVTPSLLLHPLDFLGGDDDGDLAFFPAMRLPAREKVAFVSEVLDLYIRRFAVVPMCEHAAAAANTSRRIAAAVG